MGWWIVAGALGVAAILFLLAWRPLRRWGREVQLERARELFALQRERLEAKFFDLAARGGKPRGLRWKNIDWENEVVFARDRIEDGASHVAAAGDEDADHGRRVPERRGGMREAGGGTRDGVCSWT